jgi:riboflavin synthase
MFTGLVERTGEISAVGERDQAREFTISVPDWNDRLSLGESIAVDGICLTVAELFDHGFRVQTVHATLDRTTAGEWDTGRLVNLERSLRASDRLGGHIVQGHVDDTGTVVALQRVGESMQLDVLLPDVVAEVTVLHGSIAIDGVSLTVSELPEDDVARVALIPHTWNHTNLSRLVPGERVNLEGDLIGRFVVGYLKRWSLPALG